MSNSAGGELGKTWTNCCDHNSFWVYNITERNTVLAKSEPFKELICGFSMSPWTLFLVYNSHDNRNLLAVLKKNGKLLFMGFYLKWFLIDSHLVKNNQWKSKNSSQGFTMFKLTIKYKQKKMFFEGQRSVLKEYRFTDDFQSLHHCQNNDVITWGAMRFTGKFHKKITRK